MSKPANRSPRKEITDEVNKQLTPIFSDYYPSTNQYLLYQKYKPYFNQENLRITDFLVNHLDLCKNFDAAFNLRVSGNPVTQLLFLDAITYLLETEVIGTAYIDRVLLLLIGKGIDFHLEPDYEHKYVRHAISLEDLQSPSLSLGIKQDFFEGNNIVLFSHMIDRTLRNKIAHMDFVIESNTFNYLSRNGKKVQVNLREKIQILTEYYDALTNFFFSQENKVR